jgi:hypothetical protein
MGNLKSAAEDLQQTTLRAISGVLRKLEYLSGLRDRSGTYKHWGLSRVYGESAASKALNQAHSSAVSEVLSTPINELVKEAESVGGSGAAYVEKLEKQGAGLLPAQPAPGSLKHFNSVLRALSLVLRNRQ